MSSFILNKYRQNHLSVLKKWIFCCAPGTITRSQGNLILSFVFTNLWARTRGRGVTFMERLQQENLGTIFSHCLLAKKETNAKRNECHNRTDTCTVASPLSFIHFPYTKQISIKATHLLGLLLWVICNCYKEGKSSEHDARVAPLSCRCCSCRQCARYGHVQTYNQEKESSSNCRAERCMSLLICTSHSYELKLLHSLLPLPFFSHLSRSDTNTYTHCVLSHTSAHARPCTRPHSSRACLWYCARAGLCACWPCSR